VTLKGIPAMIDQQDGQNQAGTKRRRWWLQLSLRALLAIVALLALLCSWPAWQIAQGRRQYQAVATLSAYGTHFRYDWVPPSERQGRRPEPLVDHTSSQRWRGTKWLRRVLGRDVFDEVIEARCAASDRSLDEVLVHLESLPSLQGLDLSGSNVSDTGLKYLPKLTELRHLNLLNTRVSDDGMSHLKHCEKLRSLWLGRTQVGDAGLRYLQCLRDLEYLCLSSTHVTDVGLEYLRNLRHLKDLDLCNASVSEDGLRQLQALPNLEQLNTYGISGEARLHAKGILPNCSIWPVRGPPHD